MNNFTNMGLTQEQYDCLLSDYNKSFTNNAHLIIIGEMITAAVFEDPENTFENIQVMHSTTEGAEMLRRIVKDDLGGAGDVIITALMDDL